MIIINQDKDMIVNFRNITSIITKDALIVAIDITGHTYELGYYKNNKRAKEVLLMLETILASIGNLRKEYFLMPKE